MIYCVIFSCFSFVFDLDEVCIGLGDDGVDGVVVVIDEIVIVFVEDV